MIYRVKFDDDTIAEARALNLYRRSISEKGRSAGRG